MATSQMAGTAGARRYVGAISPAMQTLESVLTEIAPTSIPVLLVGESGTGKELVALRLHELSGHFAQPFVKIKCAAAVSGRFLKEEGLSRENGESYSASGTVFFDEIAELDAACQRTLLNGLPDGEVVSHDGLLRGRVICSTTRNLEEEMRAGRFRAELFYRINGVCLRLPPLRDRKEDIPLLVEMFLTKYAEEMGRARPAISARTLRVLMEYLWPGNIRELENTVKKVVALGDEQLAVHELGESKPQERVAQRDERRTYSLKAAARAATRRAERELILDVLGRTRWNRKRAAEELQISYKSLLHKLKQIGIEGSEAKS